MSISREGAFKQGREDGLAYGLAGKTKRPEPDPVLAALDPEYENHYRQGAALGFALGQERRELVRLKAEQQIEDLEK